MQILDIADYPVESELVNEVPLEEIPVGQVSVDTLPVDTIPVDTIPADQGGSTVLFWAIVVVMFFLLVCLFFVWRYWRKHNYRS